MKGREGHWFSLPVRFLPFFWEEGSDIPNVIKCPWKPCGVQVWNCRRSATQSCSILCDPVDCSMPGFPVLHCLPDLAQTHVLWVDGAIQPSHPLPSPFPPAFSVSQHQGLFQWVDSSHQVTKVLELQLQHQSFQWIFRCEMGEYQMGKSLSYDLLVLLSVNSNPRPHSNPSKILYLSRDSRTREWNPPSLYHMETEGCLSSLDECQRVYQQSQTCFRTIILEDASPRYSTAWKEKQARTWPDLRNSCKVTGKKDRKCEWEKHLCRNQSFWRPINLVFIPD